MDTTGTILSPASRSSAWIKSLRISGCGGSVPRRLLDYGCAWEQAADFRGLIPGASGLYTPSIQPALEIRLFDILQFVIQTAGHRTNELQGECKAYQVSA